MKHTKTSSLFVIPMSHSGATASTEASYKVSELRFLSINWVWWSTEWAHVNTLLSPITNPLLSLSSCFFCHGLEKSGCPPTRRTSTTASSGNATAERCKTVFNLQLLTYVYGVLLHKYIEPIIINTIATMVHAHDPNKKALNEILSNKRSGIHDRKLTSLSCRSKKVPSSTPLPGC